MEALITEDNQVLYLIEYEGDNFDYGVNFNVYEASGWDIDTNEVVDTEHYLKGFIKWDGCSHIWFGDENGYLHICGKSYFERHKQVMDAIWDVCSKKIVKWDNDVAS